jgi:hypothetical protein
MSAAPWTCRSCGAPILWATVELSSTRMPVDADPAPEGNVLIRREPGRIWARVLGGAELRQARHEHESLHRSHFATCPDAADWRR